MIIQWVIDHPYLVSLIAMGLVALDPTNKLSGLFGKLKPLFTKINWMDKAQLRTVTREQAKKAIEHFLNSAFNREEIRKFRRKYKIEADADLDKILDELISKLFDPGKK